jgi:hypothetical protein
MEENTIEIYFRDLTPTKQKEVLKAAGISNPEEANWDAFPIAEIILGQSEDPEEVS